MIPLLDFIGWARCRIISVSYFIQCRIFIRCRILRNTKPAKNQYRISTITSKNQFRINTVLSKTGIVFSQIIGVVREGAKIYHFFGHTCQSKYRFLNFQKSNVITPKSGNF